MKATTRRKARKVQPAPEEFRTLCQAYCLVWKRQIDRAWAASAAVVAIDDMRAEPRWDVAQAYINKETKAELTRMGNTTYKDPQSDVCESWGDLSVAFSDASMLMGMAVMYKLMTEGRR